MNNDSMPQQSTGGRRFQWRLLLVAVLVMGVTAWLVYRDRRDWAEMLHEPVAGPPMHLWQGDATAAAAELPSVDQFNPVVVIPRAMPYITEFPVASAAVANKRLQEAELVLGVVVNGAARAYPINMLTGPRREILNDALGGTAIAATW